MVFNWKLKSHNERAPSYFELYANGVHAATGTYEARTSSDLKIEKSNGLDGQIRWKVRAR